MGGVFGRSCRFIPPLGVFFLRVLPVVAAKSDVFSTIRENRRRNASVLPVMAGQANSNTLENEK